MPLTAAQMCRRRQPLADRRLNAQSDEASSTEAAFTLAEFLDLRGPVSHQRGRAHNQRRDRRRINARAILFAKVEGKGNSDIEQTSCSSLLSPFVSRWCCWCRLRAARRMCTELASCKRFTNSEISARKSWSTDHADGLERLSQAHVVTEHAVQAKAVQERHPIEALALVAAKQTAWR